MKRYKIYFLFCLMFCIGFVLLSCNKKSKEPIVVIYNSYNVAHVRTGEIYYFPLSLNDGNGEMPFEIASSPEGSSKITLGGKEYLRWEPTKKGSYEITVKNSDSSFQQGYEIIVE